MSSVFKYRSGRPCLPYIVVLIAILGAAFSSLSAAQPVSETEDIDDLIAAVISSNASLESRRHLTSAREELVTSEGALEDPRISYSIAPNSIGDSIPSKFGDALRVRQNIQLSQNIPWPGKRALRSERMAASAEVAQQSFEETRLELISDTRLLWAQWWYANKALSTNLEYQRLVSEMTQVVESRYGNGIGLQQDVLRAETYAIQLRHQHLVLEQELRRLQAQLNHLLDRSPRSPLPIPIGDLAIPALPSQTVLEQLLLDAHPALEELKAKSNVAKLNQRLTEKDDYPDLQLNMGYNELWNESALRLQVGVSLNIPLDLSGKRSARKNAAQYEYHSVQMQLHSKRSELLSSLEAELSNYEQAVHGIRLIATELLPSAEQAFNATLANYEGGGGNFFDLIDAQERLLDMQLLLSKTYAEQYMALTQLNELTGGHLWSRGDN